MDPKRITQTGWWAQLQNTGLDDAAQTEMQMHTILIDYLGFSRTFVTIGSICLRRVDARGSADIIFRIRDAYRYFVG